MVQAFGNVPVVILGAVVLFIIVISYLNVIL